MADIIVRPLERGDLPAMLATYNHYILNTTVTFDLEPRTSEQWAKWADAFAPSGRHRCLVAARDGEAIGWAASVRYQERAAYETCVVTSVYVMPGLVRQGLGRRLYGALFEALQGEDIHRALAAITHPNDPSVGLHLAMGFEQVGLMPEVGRKFGRFCDVGLYLRPMP